MILAGLCILSIALAAFLLYRDRRRRERSWSEYADNDLKKFLNMPTPDAPFEKRLDGLAKESTSRKLLDEFNGKP